MTLETYALGDELDIVFATCFLRGREHFHYVPETFPVLMLVMEEGRLERPMEGTRKVYLL